MFYPYYSTFCKECLRTSNISREELSYIEQKTQHDVQRSLRVFSGSNDKYGSLSMLVVLIHIINRPCFSSYLKIFSSQVSDFSNSRSKSFEEASILNKHSYALYVST